MKVIKKDGTLEDYDFNKIKSATNKSAERVLVKLSDDDFEKMKILVEEHLKETTDIKEIHNIVEMALDEINPAVAKSYRDYRNYKQDFYKIMDEVYNKVQAIDFIGDRSNANTDSTLVSTKRCLG